MSLTRIAWPDEGYDRGSASNRHSRYEAYLRQETESFHEGGDPLPPDRFAQMCWRQATGPVMAPGYIVSANRIHGIGVERDDYAGQLVAVITFPLFWPKSLSPYRAPMDGWQDWETERSWSDSEAGEDDCDIFREPRRVDKKPTLLLMATIIVPIPLDDLPERKNPAPWLNDLPREHARLGEVDVADAKATVKAICRVLDRGALPQLNAVVS